MIRLRDHCRAAAAGMILAAVLLSAAVTVPASAAEDPSPPGGLLGIQVPSLSWKDCANRDNGLQCATAQVPRDYRNLGRGSLSLNLKRHLATDSTHRIGSLFVNPGGPGGSAAGFVSAVVSRLPAEVASRFDVVGFDPRGVAASGQVTCMTQEETEQAWAGVSASVQPGAFERGQRAAEQFNAGCQTRSGDLLSYIGTEYVARDMDLLRAAVGDKKLNYFGVSFGTFIGTVYANLFPTRIRVMALDGAYDPEAYANNPYKYDYGQYVALEGALHRFLGWCADSPDCPFGHGDPVTTYDTLVSDLDNNPVRDAHGKVVANGATLTYRVMFALNGGRPGWLGIAKDLSAAQQRGGSYVDSIGSKSSFFAANVAVECADRVYPPQQTAPALPSGALDRFGASDGLGGRVRPTRLRPLPRQRLPEMAGQTSQPLRRAVERARLRPNSRGRHDRRPGHPLPGRRHPCHHSGQRPPAYLRRRGSLRFCSQLLLPSRGGRVPHRPDLAARQSPLHR